MAYTPRTNSGASLNKKWNVNAADARYHKDGEFLTSLSRFPDALFDREQYLFLHAGSMREFAQLDTI